MSMWVGSLTSLSGLKDLALLSAVVYVTDAAQIPCCCGCDTDLQLQL